ncbi:MAG: glycine/sarcosine/betaine reductase selenoprotein B family protein [Desulfobacterales bacterium]
MSRINYVACLDHMYQSQGFPPYKWSEYDTSPWAPFNRPLSQSSIALVSSAGIFREDQKPFDPWAVNDLSFRQIPVDTPYERLRLNHNYFDHRDALKDFNCVFPVHRMKEFEQEGFIGRLTSPAITLGMGRLYKRTALVTETVPRIAGILKDRGADAVLLIAA